MKMWHRSSLGLLAALIGCAVKPIPAPPGETWIHARVRGTVSFQCEVDRTDGTVSVTKVAQSDGDVEPGGGHRFRVKIVRDPDRYSGRPDQRTLVSVEEAAVSRVLASHVFIGWYDDVNLGPMSFDQDRIRFEIYFTIGE